MTENPDAGKMIIDLTKLHPASAAGAGGDGNGGFTTTPYDRERKRETMRGWIAMLLLITLLVVIGTMIGIASYSTVGCLSSNSECTTEALRLTGIRSIGEILLAPLVGLVGAVTGFYYGEKSATERQGAG
ncbi:hypothetical protein AUC70_00015 [Methyloceanibacter stevinii]|uniref:Uncharacterized protein n=1 Tax=Methyloceanibacter stevinii TaxID=1774970 RepID=A0A1E3VVC8_9HYPH|nr:hypothetical protein [Methyloceanibacter stevinii]ODR97459.1 hypothetical protein AUC70_00015 [Methyloceanibacter stevinii]